MWRGEGVDEVEAGSYLGVEMENKTVGGEDEQTKKGTGCGKQSGRLVNS